MLLSQVLSTQQRRVESNTLFKYTFKLHEMIATGISKFLEWSWQRKANKLFEKKDVR